MLHIAVLRPDRPGRGDRVLVLEKPFCHGAARGLVVVHLPDSIERAGQPGIGNYAMFVVSAVGWCGRGITQLFVVFHSETSPWNGTDMTHATKRVRIGPHALPVLGLRRTHKKV